MAKGKKTGGRNFQKGVVTNPAGRMRIPDDVKIARKMTKNEIDLILNKFLFMDYSVLKDFLFAPDGSAGEKCVASIIHFSVKKGCPYRLDFLFNRLIGKVKDTVDHQFPRALIINHPQSRLKEIELSVDLPKVITVEEEDSSP